MCIDVHQLSLHRVYVSFLAELYWTGGSAVAFKSILAARATGSSTQAGGDYAISMAKALGAHVTGCVYALHPDFRGKRPNWTPDSLATGLLTNIVKDAHRVIEAFHGERRRS